MKKSRLLFLLPIIASFALTACDLSSLMPNTPRRRSSREEESQIVDDSFNRPSSSTSTSSTHTHKWSSWKTVQEATCANNGIIERKCTECGQVERKQTNKTNSHTWSEWEVYEAPKCETEGYERRMCQVCYIEESRTLPATGHSFDENNIYWEVEPTCTQEGRGRVYCDRCGASIDIYKSGGHNYQQVDNYYEPAPDNASVFVYRCTRCNDTVLSFNPYATTTASKAHLVFDDEGGARFWGRPIGNDLPLSNDGVSINQTDNECVYNKNQTGDFFEIIFYLSALQAEALGDCYLYCDARPANYLNGMDFWSYNQSGYSDWTPGYYIDDDPNHLNEDGTGKRVEPYRYVLYVDGNVVDFDSSIKAPVKGSNTNMMRDEYIMPYKFHLHEGINSFRLHMAGGYRSTFYNFIFRKIVDDPYEPTSREIIQEWNCENIVANLTDPTFPNIKEWDNGIKGFKFNKADNNLTLKIVSQKAVRVNLELLLAVKFANRNMTGFWKQSEIEKTVIEVNGEIIEPPAVDLDFTNVTQSSTNDGGALSYPEWYLITNINLVAGENQIVIKYLAGGYSYFMCGARITKS